MRLPAATGAPARRARPRRPGPAPTRSAAAGKAVRHGHPRHGGGRGAGQIERGGKEGDGVGVRAAAVGGRHDEAADGGDGAGGESVHRAGACARGHGGGDGSGHVGDAESGGFRHVGGFEQDQEEYTHVSRQAG